MQRERRIVFFCLRRKCEDDEKKCIVYMTWEEGKNAKRGGEEGSRCWEKNRNWERENETDWREKTWFERRKRDFFLERWDEMIRKWIRRRHRPQLARWRTRDSVEKESCVWGWYLKFLSEVYSYTAYSLSPPPPISSHPIAIPPYSKCTWMNEWTYTCMLAYLLHNNNNSRMAILNVCIIN